MQAHWEDRDNFLDENAALITGFPGINSELPEGWFFDLIWQVRDRIEDFLQVSKDGEQLFKTVSVSHSDSFAWAQDAYQRGYSIVIAHLDRISPPVSRICHDLSIQLKGRVAASAFLTPPGNVCFPVHFDTADVFMQQLTGRKYWKIGRPIVEHPLEDMKQKVPDTYNSFYLQHQLTAGETLYMPRGHCHEGKAYTDAPSLHISFTYTPTLLMDFVKNLVDSVAATEPSLRRRLTDDGKINALEVLQRLSAKPPRLAFERAFAIAAKRRHVDQVVAPLSVPEPGTSTGAFRLLSRPIFYEVDNFEQTLLIYAPSFDNPHGRSYRGPTLSISALFEPLISAVNACSGPFSSDTFGDGYSTDVVERVLRLLVECGWLSSVQPD
ncbi:JmjC domain-containing protein [Neorhizobium tomejilense]|uniref:JmjC domain-containing protein n=1 Tax=Neorhizobium tomejilense TaxID=2093828 RepID=UPI000CFA62F4|nr:cupin domain-containing protein [Neorhizobium tomejilense]